MLILNISYYNYNPIYFYYIWMGNIFQSCITSNLSIFPTTYCKFTIFFIFMLNLQSKVFRHVCKTYKTKKKRTNNSVILPNR